MKWRKLGLVYAPSGADWWARSHAYLPTVDLGAADRIRVYFAGLDEEQKGRVGFVDLDRDDPTRVVAVAPRPVLDLGEPGAFDDAGVNAACIVDAGPDKHLYYIGWQRARDVPYNIFAGLAVSDDGGETFVRRSRAPILERTDEEPFFRSATSVLRDENGYRMWYVGVRQWCHDGGAPYPEYVVRTTSSDDGLTWRNPSHVCIDFASDDEFGFGRPWVVRDGDRYRMWYSIRSRTRPYRIGYAESSDGLRWTRKDRDVGIERSAAGWDSEMICFGCVADIDGRRYMFYNGNRHGATGFGVAVLDAD
ncbi:MAG: hypothetical protein M3303_08065 [Gemmatimonadota bacterium]|nr:hypothetical protein [Gemmatimonadota bacterium]